MNQIESLEPDIFKRTILLKELLLNIFGTSYIFFQFSFQFTNIFEILRITKSTQNTKNRSQIV